MHVVSGVVRSGESAAVVGLDLVLGLSMVRRCSIKWSFKRRLVSPMSYVRYFQKEFVNSTLTDVISFQCYHGVEKLY